MRRDLGLLVLLLVLGRAPAATAQQGNIFPSFNGNGAFPAGAQFVGNGYCTGNDGAQFIPSTNGRGVCPTGSGYAGLGYCKVHNGKQFIRSQSGACPAGTNYVGAGYCASH
jgi:hypothetical protein